MGKTMTHTTQQSALSVEKKEFRLSFGENAKSQRNEFVLESLGKGRHKAVYTTFNLLDDQGRIVDQPLISETVARFIIDHFDLRGPTESFNIYQSDLESGVWRDRKSRDVQPSDVRHVLTNDEKSFTSTGAKLDHHWPIFQKFQETGYGSIIRATMTLHQVCSSRCHFCSTISRNRVDRISLEEAKDFVRTLYFDQADYNKEHFPTYNARYRAVSGTDIRLRGLILSGGGQPNLWPHFAEFVEWLSELDIDLGLITNGFPRHVPEEVYSHFKWIRVSITPEDASPFYPEQRFDLQYLPRPVIEDETITRGFSYVFGPWTSDDIIMRISQATEDYGFRYARFLTDCNLSRGAQIEAHQDLAERLYRLGLVDDQGQPKSRIFHQLKYHGTKDEADLLWQDGQCFLQVYNVFWDTTGHERDGSSYCYPCDSVTVLAEEEDGKVAASARRFDQEKWGTVPNTQVERLYQEPVRPFFDPRKNCTACLFMRNNTAVRALSERQDFDQIVPDPAVEHRNFP
jgi:hypothetical protein